MTPKVPSRLVVIAGAGRYPRLVADAARRQGSAVFVVGIAGSAAATDYDSFDYMEGGVGQIGLLVRESRTRGIADCVLIGALLRPRFSEVRPDFGLIRHLPALRRAFRGGDDHLLRGVVRIFEEVGFTVWSPAAIAPELVATVGPVGKLVAKPADRADIAEGMAVLDVLAPHDIGQSVIACEGRVVAVEGIEGTAGLLERARAMREAGRLRSRRGGILIKAPKRGQDMRVDLPVIGPETVAQAKAAGLAGIAVAAGAVLIGERADMAAAADEAGLFVEGVTWPA